MTVEQWCAEPDLAGTRLVLVRHGEAVCNAEEYIGGHDTCRGLTPLGVRQAEALARRLERTGELAGASAWCTSVLPRAIETAAILAPALGGAEFVQSCALCERHAGEADGLSWAEYAARYARRSLPGDAPEDALAPGGESWIGFLDRAAAALLELARAHAGELVVVVAHGGIVDASMIRFLGLPGHGADSRLHPEHASLTEWRHLGAKWRLVRYSDAAHLLDAGPRPDPLAPLLAPPPDWALEDRGSDAPARTRS